LEFVLKIFPPDQNTDSNFSKYETVPERNEQYSTIFSVHPKADNAQVIDK